MIPKTPKQTPPTKEPSDPPPPAVELTEEEKYIEEMENNFHASDVTDEEADIVIDMDLT